MHLLIPFATSMAPACAEQSASLRLPHLEALLARLEPVFTDTAAADSLSPPHERLLAEVCSMPAADGCLAWAAREAAGTREEAGAWAWITPVHWEVGSDHIRMGDSACLELQEAESRDLLAAMAPYFAEDGMSLHYAAPDRWLAQGAVFAALPTASLDRVVQREITPWMPAAPALRRLQNEMQMLLYTHPVNDARAARRQATVNSFWVSGTGTLPAQAKRADPPDLVVATGLRSAALAGDWAAWAQAWSILDATHCKALRVQADAGREARLTLCGDRAALGFGTVPRGWLQRLQRRWRSAPLLHTLHGQL